MRYKIFYKVGNRVKTWKIEALGLDHAERCADAQGLKWVDIYEMDPPFSHDHRWVTWTMKR